MADEFLHSIDVNALKSELGVDSAGLANLAGISENGIYKWSWPKDKQGTRPTYNAVIKMLQKGASLETLFGVKSKDVKPPAASDNVITSAELARFFAEVADSLSNKK